MNETEGLPKSQNIQTLYKFDTEFSADSVEFCPHEPFQNIFVCANYQLTENENETDNDAPKKRVGRILLFSISQTKGLILHQTIDTAAVLDQKWCHNRIDNTSLLGVVNALKRIEIYKLNTEKIELELVTILEIKDDEKETLILSLDWSTGKFESNEPDILCSDSKGNIHTIRFVNNNLLLEESRHGHDFEAWIAAFYYWNTNVTFSGGDDSLFLKYDKRVGTIPVAKNRSHNAGVTSMHSNKTKEFALVTGSYDNYVRLWDIRNIKNPISSIEMPGTLWRLKWDPFNQDYVLAACMLGGVHVVNAKNFESLEIVESYYEHKNISYGADWCYLTEKDVEKYGEGMGNIIIGTCSFYDHLLCVSKLELNKG